MLYIHGDVTETKIERAVERAFDRADAQLMRGELTQDQYDDLSDQIGNDANRLYQQFVTPFAHFAGVRR